MSSFIFDFCLSQLPATDKLFSRSELFRRRSRPPEKGENRCLGQNCFSFLNKLSFLLNSSFLPVAVSQTLLPCPYSCLPCSGCPCDRQCCPPAYPPANNGQNIALACSDWDLQQWQVQAPLQVPLLLSCWAATLRAHNDSAPDPALNKWWETVRLEIIFHLLLLKEAPIPPNTTSSSSFVHIWYCVELVGSVDPADGGVVHGWVGPSAPCPHQGQACLVLTHLTWALAAKSCPWNGRP